MIERGYRRFRHSLYTFCSDGVMAEKMTRLTKLDMKCIDLANEFEITEQVLERLVKNLEGKNFEKDFDFDLQVLEDQREYIALRYKQTVEMVSELELEIWQ